jgi:hypothetical protein
VAFARAKCLQHSSRFVGGAAGVLRWCAACGATIMSLLVCLHMAAAAAPGNAMGAGCATAGQLCSVIEFVCCGLSFVLWCGVCAVLCFTWNVCVGTRSSGCALCPSVRACQPLLFSVDPGSRDNTAAMCGTGQVVSLLRLCGSGEFCRSWVWVQAPATGDLHQEPRA